MRRKKVPVLPSWLIWEGEDFPRKIHSDSVVFYINEHLELDIDDLARKSLARALQQEGITYSLSESYKLIEDAVIEKAGYWYPDGEDRYPSYCSMDDDNYEWDATYVEVPYVF